MNPGSSKGALFALTAALIWGSQIPISKWLFKHIDAFSATAIRYCLPMAVLAILLSKREGSQALSLSDQSIGLSWRTTVWIGLIGMCMSPTLVFGGLMMTRPETAAVIVASQPSLTALVLWAVKHQRPSNFTLGTVVCAFFGVVMVVTKLDADLMPKGHELLGDVMVLFGALSWVIYTVSCERFKGWSSLRIATVAMIPGALGNLTVAITAFALGIAYLPASDQWPVVFPGLLYLALFGVLISMLVWAGAVARIGPLNAMLFLNLIPVVGFAAGYWQGKKFSAVEVTGCALVIASLVANNLYQRHQAAKKVL